MSSQLHTIDRIRVDVRGYDHNRVTKVQQQFNYTLNTAGFLRQLEALLDRMVPAGEYLEIQNIEINLKEFRENKFQEILLQQIENSIREKIKSSSLNEWRLLNQLSFEREIYVHFLRFGVLLFPAGKEILEKLYQEISILKQKPVPELEAAIKQAASIDTKVWKRLYVLIGKEGMISLAQRMFWVSEEIVVQLIQLREANTVNEPYLQTTEPEFWQRLMPMLAEQWPEDKIKAMFQMHGRKKDIIAVEQPAIAPGDLPILSKEFRNIADKGIPITNAGIVLLWMEFGKLLRQLKWVEGKFFTDKNRQQQSIILLHYISYGSREVREENCLLCKILCNWPPEEPLDPLCIPDNEDFEASDRMLKGFVDNWRREKKYSVHWFRKSFVEREGILVKRFDGNWDLQVQQKTEDILVQKVSMVKYAWMPEIIFVKWG